MSSIVEMLVNDGRFDTFVSAIQASNLTDTLNGPGPFTVFAPTDEAFAGLPEETVDRIMNDIPSLTRVVTYHVVPGQLASSDLVAQTSWQTVEGSSIKLQQLDGQTFVNDALLTGTDLRADNGLLHSIDAVLLPPKAD
jgi:uncharacterized surface protein with fasciclin (FAS1) repeats